jgi:hypothetical protein
MGERGSWRERGGESGKFCWLAVVTLMCVGCFVSFN